MKALLATAAVLALTTGTTGGALAEYRLTILHTNDFHSRVEPINGSDSTCGEEDAAAGECFGGVARLATAIEQRRDAGENTLLLDAGDQFQGSLFYTHYKGEDTAEFMEALGYEAMAVGNHEFDDGPQVLTSFVEAVDFPVLMANADLGNEPRLAELVAPSTVIEKNGERIGIIGLTPEDNNELTIAGKTIEFTAPIEAVRREVEKLEAAGIDKIILLSHSGYPVDQRIAAGVEGVDVIVGGHSHTLLSNTAEGAAGPYPTMVADAGGNDVPIVQAYAYGKYLGELNLVFDDAGNVTAATGEPILLDATFEEDAELKARVEELAQPLEALRNQVVAETAGPIDGGRDTCRAGECQMGNLVADAMLDRVAEQGTQIAIVNGGGLRASIDAGEITMGEVLTVLPFQNTLSTFELKGSDIVAALENGVSQVEDGGGRFPQVAGLKFEWSRSGTPGENRIGEVQVKEGNAFVPLDPEKTYLVVSNNFMRGGGDGYAVFAESGENAYDYGPALENVLADYLAEAPAPYEPYTDGRISEAQ